MKPYKINLFIYAENDAEASKLEKAFYEFISMKREQGIAVKASCLCEAIEKFKDNIILNNYLKK